MVLLLGLILKVFIHIEKRHDESLEKLEKINKKLYEELSLKEKSLTQLNDEVGFITNFIKENDSIGEEESRKKLEYRLSEAFLKTLGKTKLQFDIENIEYFYSKHKDMGEEFRNDRINDAKKQEKNYSAFIENKEDSNIKEDDEGIPEHIRPILNKLTNGEELSTFETMMLLEDSQRDDN